MADKRDDNLLERLLDPTEKPVCAAPLAGWTDASYRPILLDRGARHVWVPFVSTHAVASRKSPDRDAYVRDVAKERCHVQIFGSVPDICATAAKILEDAGAKTIDFNCGCSVRKVHKGGGGSALLRDLDLLAANLKAIIGAVSIPVSLKTRIGYYTSPDDRSGIEACRRAQDLGCAWVTLHCRTAKMGFGGEPDWEAIAGLVSELSIPVIGNGGIGTPDDSKRMFETTGCAGVMIGRAIMGDPWLVGDCERFMTEGAPRPKRTRSAMVEVMLEHQRRLLAQFQDKRGILEFRKHVVRYLRGFAQASLVRNRIVRCDDPGEVARILLEFGEGRPPASIDGSLPVR